MEVPDGRRRLWMARAKGYHRERVCQSTGDAHHAEALAEIRLTLKSSMSYVLTEVGRAHYWAVLNSLPALLPKGGLADRDAAEAGVVCKSIRAPLFVPASEDSGR